MQKTAKIPREQRQRKFKKVVTDRWNQATTLFVPPCEPLMAGQCAKCLPKLKQRKISETLKTESQS